MKQSKGITLVSLIIIVIILMILAGVAIITTTPLVERANVENITTELMLIQAKWKIEIEKVNFDGNSTLDESIIIAEGENKGKLADEYKYSAEEKTWAESGVTYYRLPDKALESMGIDVESNKGYVVNYNNDEIIYIQGIETKNGTTYYKLSDIKGL